MGDVSLYPEVEPVIQDVVQPVGKVLVKIQVDISIGPLPGEVQNVYWYRGLR